MHFIAEKVCHNPVVLAWHAEGEGWELYATSSGKTKFWGKFDLPCSYPEIDRILLSGKSMEIIPQGTIHLRLGDEHFEWCVATRVGSSDCIGR